MNSLWNDTEADLYQTELELRAYTSRLLGANPELVLHGGGNTSVKLTERDLTGEDVALLYVKGSGWDLATIQPQGFAPVRMDRLLKLAQLPAMTDLDMGRELRVATVNPAAPAPSVEAILHAVLPFKFVDHTHTDALVTIMNTPHGLERIRGIYGNRVVVIPYVMPGFPLARLAAQAWQAQSHAATIGLVLMNHGLFTFADTARASYEIMITLVSEAEAYLQRNNAWELPSSSAEHPARDSRMEIAALRLEISRVTQRPMIVISDATPASLEFARRSDLGVVAGRGPATPDHVIRTKRLPLIGRDVGGYAAQYEAYFARQAGLNLTMLDAAPRVVLDEDLGLLTVGTTAKDARIAQDIYRHTVQMISRAERLESWQALPEAELFAVEYWDLEQVKLKSNGVIPEFQGEVALVTGCASGIGKACAAAFLQRGAAVIGLDINPQVSQTFAAAAFLGLPCDITDEEAIKDALERGVRAFGGLDMMVLNAGIFPKSAKISELSTAIWTRTMQVNVDANLVLMREAHGLLKLAPNGGRVVVNASKNVPAPGPGAGAYSASKAALTQLARVAALEWGADRIRVNIMHPDAVFDTGLWDGGVLEPRAQSYGLSVEEYKTKNVLKAEVSSQHVAELAAALCGSVFARTTGAQVPVDGGNDRVI